jgi:hypothetical protein
MTTLESLQSKKARGLKGAACPFLSKDMGAGETLKHETIGFLKVDSLCFGALGTILGNTG